MRSHALCLTILGAALAAGPPAAAQPADDANAPRLYVPYEDVPAVIGPADRAVLMDREAFAKLLAAAQANEKAAAGREVAQITEASYQARIDGETLTLTGTLTVVSLSDRPVAVPLGFGQVGLSRVGLDGKPAPLGYDAKGRLVLIVTGRGRHGLSVAATGRLKELAGGGVQFGLSMPATAAGTLRFGALGDLEVHATVPVASLKYDKPADRTDVVLAVGGHDAATVVLMGNGRQEDERAILLGTSATTVRLTAADQALNCLYTVQVLRRGVRELTFALPAEWTVTDVSCPSLVRWSVAAPAKAGDPQRLTVRLRTAGRGTKAVTVQATAPRQAGGAWTSPFVRLENADFQHGHLLVDTGGDLAVRGQSMRQARRKDLSLAALVPGLIAATQGRMFYHWSDDWSVRLDLDAAALRRSSEARHRLAVTPEEITLTSTFEVTAIGRELFDLAFELPPAGEGWAVGAVRVNGKDKGFEYRVVEQGAERLLKVALASPLRAEAAAKVTVSLRHVPADWAWPAGAAPREVRLPVVRAQAETVSGLVAVAPSGDLDVAPAAAPEGLAPVNVGRMSLLGLAGDVRLAYTYDAPVADALRVRVSRRSCRLSAESIGLVTAKPTKLTGLWRIQYQITRAHARKLYLLADKALGEKVKLAAPGLHLASKTIVAPGKDTVELPAKIAAACNLWELTLDSQAIGPVRVDAQYDEPVTGSAIPVPLIRPIGADHTTEMLAIQASEELAVTVKSAAASDVDAIDLPPLPAPATRLLRAFRLDAPTADAPAPARIELTTTVHEKYEIPVALAADAHLTTYLGPRGRTQRTRAVFRVANAGLQFLTFRLPAGAELWSVQVAGRPAKPTQSGPDTYRVALARSASAQVVTVIYAWDDPAPGGRGGRLRLGRAVLGGVRTNRLRWTVVPPPGRRIARQYTAMDAETVSRPQLAGERVIDGLKELFGLTEAVLAIGSQMMAVEAEKSMDYARERADEYGAVTVPKAPEAAGAEAADKEEETTEGERRTLRRRAATPVVKLLGPEPRDPASGGARAELGLVPATQPAGPGKPKSDKAPARGEPMTKARAVGRFTLPVQLAGTVDAGQAVTYTTLGEGELAVCLAAEADEWTYNLVGLAAVLLIGFVMIRCCPARRAAFLLLVLAGSTLVAIWVPAAAFVANGAFYGGLWLIPVYVLVGVLRWLWPRVLGVLAYLAPREATSAVLIAALLLTAGTADAGGKAATTKGKPAAVRAKPAPPPARKQPPLVVPYDGDPTKAEAAGKVLVPYRRYVELWNRANPDRQIEVPRAPVEVSLAGVRYAATLEGERMNLVLTARVRTFGDGAAVLPVPMTGLAVQSATLDGKDARLQVGGKGLILTLPGGIEGELRIAAVTTPKTLGRRGSVRLGLPPLPGAVMTVELPDADLELEAPGIEGAVTKPPAGAGKPARWTVPLGAKRDVTLRWSPKVGAGAADRTLSAAAAHDVHAFHWAMVGVSKIGFTFSAGSNERFGLLLPAELTLTGLTGANLRDFRETGRRTVDGVEMKVVEIRLHRPATKGYEVTARWVGKLPALGEPVRVPLPRAADVGRESGTVTLHAAGGMTMKVLTVTGGRRSALAAGGKNARKTLQQASSVRVARYYWPYRPFRLTVQLARHVVDPEVALDQLVRLDRRQVQLLVQANLQAERGRVFGASFTLPAGYELLSAIGPVVEDHYEQQAAGGRRLHVNFRTGVPSTRVALVLVRKDAEPAALDVPAVTMIDPAGKPLDKQTGRLAVQVAASLEAETAASTRLRSIPPRQLSGWLDAKQTRAVQFAYRFDEPGFALRLTVRPQKTKARVEVFAALSVRPTLAWYSYRLRYRIEGTPVDQVRFTLPTKYAPLVAVGSPALRGVRKRALPADGAERRTEWTVDLIHEVTGTLDVTVNFAVPLDASTSGLTIPRIGAPAPTGHEGVREAYRAIVAVQNASRHKLHMLSPKNLSPLPQSEQRKLLSETVRKNLQFVHQSFTDDWSAVLKLTPAEAAARVQAVVDLMALTTVIDRAGRSRCHVRLMLQNRTRQFLRVRVPGDLRLWSARVAGQPVKPVTDANAAADAVLIPLVKTSPGGLPYDVELYLAATTDKPLGMIREVRPPAVEVLDVKVERTTWSLRLPRGYRYLRPGGNLSRVLGETEQKLQVIGTRLRQAKRLRQAYEELVSAGSYRGQEMAQQNWKVFNRDLSREITTLRGDIDRNVDQLSSADNTRLKKQLEDLSRSQYGMLSAWDKNVREQQDRTVEAINPYLNNTAFNGGVAEIARNDFLNAVPTFVRSAAEQQKQVIAEEIRGNEAVIKTGANAFQQDIAAGNAVLEGGKLRLGKDQVVTLDEPLDIGGTLILNDGQDAAKDSQVAMALSRLQADQRRNTVLRQKELQNQLTLLGSNRLERYYGNLAEQGQVGGQQIAQSQAQPQVQIAGETFNVNGGTLNLPAQRPQTGYGGGRAQPGPQPGRSSGRRQEGRFIDAPGEGATVTRDDRGSAGDELRWRGRHGGLAVAGGEAYAPADQDGDWSYNAWNRAWGDTGLAVARGTFSLPVSLPAGGEQWDFQGPTGEPVVSILAVDEDLLEGAYSTGAVLVISIVLCLLGRLWRQLRRTGGQVGAVGFVSAYVVLAGVLAALVLTGGMSLMGAMVLFGAIVCPVELIHRLLARRAAPAA